MTTDEEFLFRLQQDPGNNVLRLAYADWLEERGDPRAEYLRLLIEYRDLSVRMAQLRRQLPTAWTTAVSPWCRVTLVRFQPEKRRQVLQLWRELTDQRIAELSTKLDQLPQTIRTRISLGAATAIATAFEDVAEVVISLDEE
ncbi:MAG: TIGR02996 domain-containing protein [Gemmataceae bacterium]